VIFTLGHSSRSWEQFIGILKEYKIEVVVDIRRFPSSRKFPWFNKEFMEKELEKYGMKYMWKGEKLGGRLKPRKESRNVAIKSPGFRAYADMMQTDEFAKEVEKLIKLAKKKRICLICAEKLPWRCHRWFLSDFLVFKGEKIVHVIEKGKEMEHKLSKHARAEKGVLIYDLD